uniref:Uncharacterized protein n=1 Tax=Anguilla anguilla TaxID=7936 RepID=A0A0E9V2L2_ANGAN
MQDLCSLSFPLFSLHLAQSLRWFQHEAAQSHH